MKTPIGFTSYFSALTIASALVLGSAVSVNAAQHFSSPRQNVSAAAVESAAKNEAPAVNETPAAAVAPTTEPSTETPPAEKGSTEPTVTAAVTANAYTISEGDTVSTVAARYGVELDKMLAANGLTIDSAIAPGEVLKFTGPAVPLRTPSAAPKPAVTDAQIAPVSPAGEVKTKPAVKPAPVKASSNRVITIAGSGGQSAVDRCIGPIHFTPVKESFSIVEHNNCGGWARFSGIQVGETVTITGKGTYKVTGRGVVPNPGSIANVSLALGSIPTIFLQTCIPGTNTMLVIGLA